MNTIREISKINEQELQRNLVNTAGSWHNQYLKSAWVYIGNVDIKLTEGDIMAVMSQYGEIDDMHLVRDDDTGKSKGFAFIKYEDSRSCVLAIDNFVGIQLCGRSLRIDHVENYRLPKHLQEKQEEEEQANKQQQASTSLSGHAYEGKELANKYSIHQGQDLFAPKQQQQQQQPSSADADTALQPLGGGGSVSGKAAGAEGLEEEDKKEAKRLRKEERARIRQEREKRRIDREERRDKKKIKKEERRRRHDEDDDNNKNKRDKKRSSRRKHHSSSSREKKQQETKK